MINKRTLSLFFIIAIGVFIYLSAYGSEPPALKDIAVKTQVNFSLESGIFSYAYSVTNPPTNTGLLWVINIDISKPVGGAELSSEGLVNGPGYLRHSSEAILEQSSTTPMIPVGIESPANWMGGLSVAGKVQWGTGSAFMVLPGQNVSGFQITSHGLPGIREFRGTPHLEDEHLPLPPTGPEDLERYNNEYDALHDSVSAKGKTLGPTAPPAQFMALDFLAYLVDLKHQAVALGWITNKGVENSLDVKLEQVKKKLQAGDSKTASNVLSAFINEVNAQGCEKYEGCPAGKHLLPEAWALLKFNAQYLLGRL